METGSQPGFTVAGDPMVCTPGVEGCGPPCIGGSEIDENKEAVRRGCRAVETVLVLLRD